MQLITSGIIRSDIEQVVRSWIDWYMGQAEQNEINVGLDALVVDRPRAWRLALTRDAIPDTRQIPMVVTSVGHWTAERHPGEIDGTFDIAINVIVRGDDWDDTSRRCGIYGAAIAAILVQQLPTHPRIVDCHVDDIGYDVTVQAASRTIGEVVVTAKVGVASVIAPRARELAAPPVDLAAADVPTALTVTANLTRKGS